MEFNYRTLDKNPFDLMKIDDPELEKIYPHLFTMWEAIKWVLKESDSAIYRFPELLGKLYLLEIEVAEIKQLLENRKAKGN